MKSVRNIDFSEGENKSWMSSRDNWHTRILFSNYLISDGPVTEFDASSQCHDARFSLSEPQRQCNQDRTNNTTYSTFINLYDSYAMSYACATFQPPGIRSVNTLSGSYLVRIFSRACTFSAGYPANTSWPLSASLRYIQGEIICSRLFSQSAARIF